MKCGKFLLYNVCAYNTNTNKETKCKNFAPNISGLEFRNELVRRLNNNATRYTDAMCNGRRYPQAEFFEVDEIYEIIDRVLGGIPEDDGSTE